MGSENQTPPTESLQDKSLLPSSRTTAQPTHQPAPVLPKPPDYGVSRVPGFVEYEEVAPAPAYTPVAYSAPRTAPPSLPAVPQQSGQGYAHPIASAPTSQLPRHVGEFCTECINLHLHSRSLFPLCIRLSRAPYRIWTLWDSCCYRKYPPNRTMIN